MTIFVYVFVHQSIQTKIVLGHLNEAKIKYKYLMKNHVNEM